MVLQNPRCGFESHFRLLKKDSAYETLLDISMLPFFLNLVKIIGAIFTAFFVGKFSCADFSLMLVGLFIFFSHFCAGNINIYF